MDPLKLYYTKKGNKKRKRERKRDGREKKVKGKGP
jgi:hypothetical protein